MAAGSRAGAHAAGRPSLIVAHPAPAPFPPAPTLGARAPLTVLGPAHRGRTALSTLALAMLLGGGATHSSGARSETAANLVHTWSDAATAGGVPGRIIPSQMAVTVTCAEHGFKVADGDTWWYRIGSTPWKGRFYASADPFYNNGHTSGALKGTPYVDPKVPHC